MYSKGPDKTLPKHWNGLCLHFRYTWLRSNYWAFVLIMWNLYKVLVEWQTLQIQIRLLLGAVWSGSAMFAVSVWIFRINTVCGLFFFFFFNLLTLKVPFKILGDNIIFSLLFWENKTQFHWSHLLKDSHEISSLIVSEKKIKIF